MARNEPTASGAVDPLGDRLDSWKEIAAYLGRGVRTVQRWEREEGLPVHRLAHESDSLEQIFLGMTHSEAK